jgi:hypothetical protein
MKMMRNLFSILIVTALMAACASLPRYSAPFSEVDQDRDSVIEWREFKIYYPDADPKAFLEADRNKNGEITPDEWRFYVETQTP